MMVMMMVMVMEMMMVMAALLSPEPCSPATWCVFYDDFDDDDGGDHDDGNGDGDGDGSPAHRLTVEEQFVKLLLLRLSKSLLSCWSSNCGAQDVKRCLGNMF